MDFLSENAWFRFGMSDLQSLQTKVSSMRIAFLKSHARSKLSIIIIERQEVTLYLPTSIGDAIVAVKYFTVL